MKKLLVLLAAFSLSAAAVSAQTMPHAPRQHRHEQADQFHKSPEQRADLAAQRMATQLDLSNSQTKKVRQLQLDRYQQMQQFRTQRATAGNNKFARRNDMKAYRAQYDAQLKKILSNKQYKKYAQLRADRMAKHKQARSLHS